MDLGCTLFLHTRASLAAQSGPAAASEAAAANLPSGTGSGGLLAVVEVVLVERCDSGVPCAEYSAGWCAIPLEHPAGSGTGDAPSPYPAAAARAGAGHGSEGAASFTPKHTRAGCTPLAARCARQPASPAAAPAPAAGAGAGSSPFSPLRSGVMAARLGAHSMLCVPVYVGSPRLLLLQRALPPGQCPAPPMLAADGAECRLHYQVCMLGGESMQVDGALMLLWDQTVMQQQPTPWHAGPPCAVPTCYHQMLNPATEQSWTCLRPPSATASLMCAV